jgi:hypothetical protein
MDELDRQQCHSNSNELAQKGQTLRTLIGILIIKLDRILPCISGHGAQQRVGSNKKKREKRMKNLCIRCILSLLFNNI